jgi:conjugal transfer pilus assembly protein TraL
MDKYHIPQYLDEPARIILWTIDEAVVFLVPFFILLWVFNQAVLGGITGTALVLALKKLKGEQGHYFLYSLMYWYLPAMVRFRSVPPSYYREFVG